MLGSLCNKGTLALAGLAMVVTVEARSASQGHTEVDVVVVGGGYSGLMSGYELQQAGLNAVVLEADDIIGGRSRSHKLKDGKRIVELGATWINNQTQPLVFELAQQFGLETAEQYTNGFTTFQGLDKNVELVPANATTNTLNPEIAVLEGQLIFAILEATANLSNTRWDNFPEEMDVTWAEWVMGLGIGEHEHILGFANQLSTSLVGRDADEVGAHYLLDYIVSGDGFESLVSEGKVGAQSLKIRKGTTAIATSLAEAMDEDSVHTSSPVVSIHQKDNYTLVKAKKGKKGHQTFKAKKVILAIPTNKYSEIDFKPNLPCVKNYLYGNTMPGVYAKMIVSYEKPWWREAGLSGKFTSHVGPINFGWETSDPEFDQYSLAFFIAGSTAAKWHKLPHKKRESSVIEHLAELVGEELADEARNTEEINYVEWTKEKYLGGAPTSSMRPGMLRKHGDEFRKPFGNIHFGGGEFAYMWKGYLEGALTAGQEAARQVTESLEG